MPPEKRAAIAAAWKTILVTLGYDPSAPHFADTPERVARFLAEWHTQRNDVPPPKVTVFPSDGVDQIICVTDIPFYSACAHHGVPFHGTAAIGYIPNGKVAGLSKFARVVDHFARRFTTQEVLTRDVAAYLEETLHARGVGVMMRAEHLCMSMRGVQKPGCRTRTSEVRGVFRTDPAARAELLGLLDAGGG